MAKKDFSLATSELTTFGMMRPEKAAPISPPNAPVTLFTPPSGTSPLDMPKEAQKIEQPKAETHGVYASLLVRQQEEKEEANANRTPTERKSERPSVGTYDRTSVRIETRRDKKRYAFEFFQDQIDTLKRFSLEDQGQGESGNMSQMVREAIDAYISKRK